MGKHIAVELLEVEAEFTKKKVMIKVDGTASVKISFSIRFLSRCFFSLNPFTGWVQKSQMILAATS